MVKFEKEKPDRIFNLTLILTYPILTSVKTLNITLATQGR